jgi:hypothetical protein
MDTSNSGTSSDFESESETCGDPGIQSPRVTALTQADVIRFVAEYFEEDAPTAIQRLRPRRYGWEVDTQPMNGELLLGPGPVIIDGKSGDYWETSSSPSDIFGDAGMLGWSELKTQALFERWKDERRAPDGNVLKEMSAAELLDKPDE